MRPYTPKRRLKSSPVRWLPWSSWDGLSCWPPHFYPRDRPRPPTGAASSESLLLRFARVCPQGIQLIEGHANPLLFPPYDVAGPVHIVGLDDQFESVGNIERAEYFERSPGRRQASYGAADGSAAAEPNCSRLQNTPSRCPAVFVHGGSIGVEFKISVNPQFAKGR
jgi:hypothetical protein